MLDICYVVMCSSVGLIPVVAAVNESVSFSAVHHLTLRMSCCVSGNELCGNLNDWWSSPLTGVSLPSLILPLPQNVIEYLLDDGTLVVSGR